MILQEDIDFLAHQGVKGMRWGVTNKKARSESKQTTSASKATHLTDGTTSPKTATPMSKRTKKSIAIGTGLTAAYLAVMGVFTLAAAKM
jgi:hypothetical protein